METGERGNEEGAERWGRGSQVCQTKELRERVLEVWQGKGLGFRTGSTEEEARRAQRREKNRSEDRPLQSAKENHGEKIKTPALKNRGEAPDVVTLDFYATRR